MKLRHVSISAAVKAELAGFAQRCKILGRHGEFVRAISQIAAGLGARRLPPAIGEDVFGCPLYHLPNLGLLICNAAVAPVSVLFGIKATQPLQNGHALPPVFVMRFKLMQ